MNNILLEPLQVDDKFHNVNTFHQLYGGASGRKFYRVLLENLGIAILCDASSVKHPKQMIHRHIITTSIFRKRNISAPKIISSDFERWILFEDVGTRTLANLLSGQNMLKNSQLSKIGTMLRGISTVSLTSEEYYDVGTWENSSVHQKWILNLHGDCKKFAEELKSALTDLPHALMHGDMQCRNLLWNDTNRLSIVDLQDATWAPYVLDTSLLCVDPNFEKSLLDPATAVDLLNPSFKGRPLVIEEIKLGMLFQCFRLMHRCYDLWRRGFGYNFLREAERSKNKILSSNFIQHLSPYISNTWINILNKHEYRDCTASSN